MNRHDWEFEYTAKTLADAAELARESRQQRSEWWIAKKEEVMQEVRDTGIEISESVAAEYSNTKMGMGPRVLVKGDLQNKLTECFTKIREHEAAASEYAGWVQVLEANPEARLKLTHQDWLYFFGK